MGSGTWSRDAFVNYTCSTKMGATLDSLGSITTTYSNQELFKSNKLDPALNPYKVTRECVDTEEHPNTLPVILALDVTGSLGDAAVEVAKKLNVIMTDLYDKVKDVEFMIMGIGDMYCDRNPLQVSQFESDIRIAEQLDKLYFEFGGGGNYFESYSLAWYFGLRHCKLDCWNRGKKGVIITMGDERLNPYIPKTGNRASFLDDIGDNIQSDVDTKELYGVAKEKFDIYHLHVDHDGRNWDEDNIKKSWGEYLDDKHFKVVTMDSITNAIVDIIMTSVNSNESVGTVKEISW